MINFFKEEQKWSDRKAELANRIAELDKDDTRLRNKLGEVIQDLDTTETDEDMFADAPAFTEDEIWALRNKEAEINDDIERCQTDIAEAQSELDWIRIQEDTAYAKALASWVGTLAGTIESSVEASAVTLDEVSELRTNLAKCVQDWFGVEKEDAEYQARQSVVTDR